MRNFDGSETFARTTPIGGAVIVAYTEGWLRVWDGNEQLKGDAGQKHLWKHSSVDISFTDKGIRDIAALLYGYEDSTG